MYILYYKIQKNRNTYIVELEIQDQDTIVVKFEQKQLKHFLH